MGRVDEDPGLKPLSLFLTIFRGLKAPAPSDEILTCSEGIFSYSTYIRLFPKKILDFLLVNI